MQRLLRGLAAAGAAVLLAAPSPARADDKTEILVHHAFGTPRHFTLEGRVAERHDRRPADREDSRIVNLWRSLRVAAGGGARERRGAAEPRRRTWTVRSDRYFASSGDTPRAARGGPAAGGERRRHCADAGLRSSRRNTVGSSRFRRVIVSEVPDRSRLATHSLLENYLQRRPVDGMAALYREILARNPLPAAAPAIYLTASPRQLQPAIAAFLEHNGFPRGPIVARKITDGGGGDPLLDQERYKLDRIERILSEFPGLRFVLVGDDGERDPEIYEASPSPGRIGPSTSGASAASGLPGPRPAPVPGLSGQRALRGV
jgi:hypothetical protein